MAADPQSFDAAKTEILQRLRGAVDPLAMGLAVRDVRADALTASRGATDFGEYFIYFSFFLVVSALLLAALFFRLGIEQRVREVGLLRAVGLGPGAVQRLFLAEGVSLAFVGSVLGVLGAIGYAALLMAGLRTWWVDAVGTTALEMHVTTMSLLAGAIGGVLAAAICIWWTLRSLARVTERSLLAGQLQSEQLQTPALADRSPGKSQSGVGLYRCQGSRTLVLAAGGLLFAGVGLIAAGAGGVVNAAGAFFGAGSLLLAASLCMCAFVLRRRAQRVIHGRGWWPVSWLGMRSATYRPGRSVLSMAVIARATFILIAVSAFRRDGAVATNDPHSGTGGYELMVELLVPIVHDPNSAEGRDALNLFDLDSSVRIDPFRVLPGDDASCLNLYEPKNPRIVAPRAAFVGRPVCVPGVACRGRRGTANPWRLLEQSGAGWRGSGDRRRQLHGLRAAPGARRRAGDHRAAAARSRCGFVASLRDSIFQSELLMSEANFLKLFPEQDGFQFLVDRTPAARGDCRGAVKTRRGAEERAGRISARDFGPMPRAESGSRRSTAWRTRTCQRFRRSAASVCCSARSVWPPCCSGTSSNGAASWRCWAPSAIGRGIFC